MLVGWSVLDLGEKVTFRILNGNSNVSSDSNYSADSIYRSDSSHNGSRSVLVIVWTVVTNKTETKKMCTLFFDTFFFSFVINIDEVGPVDNRPSLDWLHQVTEKNNVKTN